MIVSSKFYLNFITIKKIVEGYCLQQIDFCSLTTHMHARGLPSNTQKNKAHVMAPLFLKNLKITHFSWLQGKISENLHV